MPGWGVGALGGSHRPSPGRTAGAEHARGAGAGRLWTRGRGPSARDIGLGTEPVILAGARDAGADCHRVRGTVSGGQTPGRVPRAPCGTRGLHPPSRRRAVAGGELVGARAQLGDRGHGVHGVVQMAGPANVWCLVGRVMKSSGQSRPLARPVWNREMRPRSRCRSRISSGQLASSAEPCPVPCAEPEERTRAATYGGLATGGPPAAAARRGCPPGGPASPSCARPTTAARRPGRSGEYPPWIQRRNNRSSTHRGEKNRVPEPGFLEAVPAQGGAAQDGGDPCARPRLSTEAGGAPEPRGRTSRGGGARWDRPERGSRI